MCLFWKVQELLNSAPHCRRYFNERGRNEECRVMVLVHAKTISGRDKWLECFAKSMSEENQEEEEEKYQKFQKKTNMLSRWEPNRFYMHTFIIVPVYRQQCLCFIANNSLGQRSNGIVFSISQFSQLCIFHIFKSVDWLQLASNEIKSYWRKSQIYFICKVCKVRMKAADSAMIFEKTNQHHCCGLHRFYESE